MENRREYFDCSKIAFNRVKKHVFLSELQSEKWLAWSEEEHFKLKSLPALIPLSVSDELAFPAGIPCSLNTALFSTEKMQEKRKLLRYSIRNEMGLLDNDMFVMSLSSVNPGKCQLLLLESARLILEQGLARNQDNFKRSLLHNQEQRTVDLLLRAEGKQEQKLKVLIGSVGCKRNKVPYVKTLVMFVSQHPNLSKSVLWTPATTRVASHHAAADVSVKNS